MLGTVFVAWTRTGKRPDDRHKASRFSPPRVSSQDGTFWEPSSLPSAWDLNRWLYITRQPLARILSGSVFIWAQGTGSYVHLPIFLPTRLSSDSAQLFVRLAVVTVGTFTLLFLPFLPPLAPISAVLDPIARIFPFNRGIFEDKVANFWCASNVVVKWRLWVSQSSLMRLSTLLTLVGFLGAAIAPIRAWLRLRNEKRSTELPPVMQTILLLALLNSSMSFFLFSFQVHEKTILLPLLPLTLLLSTAPHDSSTFKLGVLANNVGVFRCVFIVGATQ